MVVLGSTYNIFGCGTQLAALKNWRLVIEYDGSRYCGWQVQPQVNTVQAEVERALTTALREKVSIQGSGRTDAGVHADGQVANFKTDAEITAHRLRWQLNALLPRDIVVHEIVSVGEDFDARRSAIERTYSYLILSRPVPSVFWRSYSFWVSKTFNIEAAVIGAKALIGTHDFSAFTVAKVGSMVRRVTALDVLGEHPVGMASQGGMRAEGLITIRITANAFLHHMVRLIVGTLVEVAAEKIEPGRVKEILDSKDIRQAGPRAPAKGLRLEKVSYLGNLS